MSDFQDVTPDFYIISLLNTESSSRIYSPYVFAIGQLVGELPYNVLCAIIYWVLMVRSPLPYLVRSQRHISQVYPMGYGQGSAGIPGTLFQLLIINFVMALGVSLGQMIAAFSPSIQVLPSPFRILVVTKQFQGCCSHQSFYPSGPWHFLWCFHPIPSHYEVLAVMALPT